ncbi:MAG: ATPase, T2SS/T4P/T4SS family [Candidatus Ancaeobacter aquaticus]|nr:ATPase, T2SS/T4P/T4SS family [Candidatus Ancaeobacter aquaticus]
MKTLVETLIEKGLITEDQLREAKDKQIGAKKPLHELLVDMGFIEEKAFMEVLSSMYNFRIVDLENEEIDEEGVAKILPYEKAKHYGVFPVRVEDDVFVLAMSNPLDMVALEDIRLISNMEIKPLLCSKGDITEHIERYYHSDEIIYDLFEHMVGDVNLDVVDDNKNHKKLFEIEAFKEKQGPVVKLVNMVISDAVRGRASDIHIEPGRETSRVRYRVDGDLSDVMKIPSKLHKYVVSCIKVMAEMNVAESRKPQDGRAKVYVNGKNIDLRISMIPIHFGEKAVMRLLDPTEAKVGLDNLGFSKHELQLFKKSISKPQGIILVTGPTGSGKTSTLYAALNYMKSDAKNIITIEDPIEYLVDGVNQMQVNPVIDVTFANGLRSLLRQDPNVILVGEIRDRETADIAFRSSLTGHLVLSTLHTNNTVMAITRLLDIGLEPYLIASSLNMIAAQRLIKVVCFHCREEYEPEKELIKKFSKYIDEYKIKEYYRGKGCQWCNYKGFLGRTAMLELLVIDEKIRKLISDNSGEEIILKTAVRHGMKLLAESGFEKVAQGLTTIEEVARITEVVETEEDPLISEAVKTEEVPDSRDKQKILIADDEDHILMMLESRFNNAGFDVVKARNGREAVEIAFREKPDLIVMDVSMPEMNGFEATKMLRSKLETAVIPILMLTAKKDVESELKGIDAGADDYVAKPFDGDRLLARIKMLLRRKR